MTAPLTPQRARAIQRRWPVVSGITAVVLVVGLGAIVALRSGPYEFDAEWLEELVEVRAPFWSVLAMLMNFIGGGWFSIVVPIGVGVVLLIARKPWSALYFVLTSAVSGLLVQLLKNLFDRARPELQLVTADFGSFPSGHVANAATVSVGLAIMLTRVWVWLAAAAYTALMALSRTYLGVHWLSDTVGGALLGGAVAILVWAPFAERLRREWRPGAPDPGPPPVSAD